MVDVYIKYQYFTEDLGDILHEYTNIQDIYIVDDNDRRNQILQGKVIALISPHNQKAYLKIEQNTIFFGLKYIFFQKYQKFACVY